jgi:acyl transferase domain-containing protein/acyl carrier protein
MKTKHEIQLWLQSKIAGILNVDAEQVDPNERFKDYGLDSKLASALINQLAAWLDKKLEQTLVWDYPTITELVDFLVNPVVQVKKQNITKNSFNESEPIAIIGLGCRFPNAPDKLAYWELLKNGISGITRVPGDRWEQEDYFDADVSKKGKMNTSWGGFIDQVDKFDPEFFGISPREANHMDPQQRLMLEVSWEALEDAGIDPNNLKGSKTGVFYSAIWNDYLILNSRLGVNNIVQHTATGMHHSIIPNRVSYFLGLKGPSMAVDTACSSSLVTVHLAIQSLRRGESTMAMAGGVNLIIAPDTTIGMTKFGAMAPDGLSKAFDSRADGYVRGEGAGVVILKPLTKALIDGDNIYALVLESATNNDGFSNGLTAPNPKAQQEVLEEAYQRAGVDPNDVDYIETHGTGTILGDPIEAKAIGKILCTNRSDTNQLILGSVKTNIGHLEGAAGIAGLIKVVLAIKHRQIPPNLNFEKPNPNIPFDELHLKIPQKLLEWPDTGRPGLAGVSSFGFGGSNCHVVVGEFAPANYQLLPISADTGDELKKELQSIIELINSDDLINLAVFCSEKSNEPVRACKAVFVAQSRQQLNKQLVEFIENSEAGAITQNSKDTSAGQRPLVFVCSGQGSQWAGMAKNLIWNEPIFRAKIEECDQEYKAIADWSVIEQLITGESASTTEFIQPVIFAIQVSLAALWASWGIRPNVVLGHSMGEIAAAHISGILTLKDAIRVVYCRSKMLSQIAGKGSMAMVELSGDKLDKALKPFGGLISIAAYNSPVSTVISGDSEAIKDLIKSLEMQNVFNRLINVDIASHSYQTDILKDDLLAQIAGVSPLPGNIPLISTVHPSVLSAENFVGSYWVDNVRMPVKFLQAVSSLVDQQDHVFIELSPHPILTRSINEICGTERNCLALGSMERDEDERKSMFNTLSKLHINGYAVNWKNVYKNNIAATPDALKTGAQQSRLFPLSAHSQKALVDLAVKLKKTVDTDNIDFENLAYTAALKRTHQQYRLGITASNLSQLSDGLGSSIDNQSRLLGQVKKKLNDNIVFVFSGQGGQWLGMASDLYENEVVFQNVIKKCDVLLKEISGNSWSLIDKIKFNHSHFVENDTEIIQPVVFAVQVALAALWQSWGVKPKAVTGHSLGEIAAAYVAGSLDLRDAVKIVYYRALFMQRGKGAGAMVLIHHPADVVQACLDDEGFNNKVSIAAYNSNANTLVSGKKDAVAAFTNVLNFKGLYYKEFSTEYAFHCPLMNAYSDDFYKSIADITPQKSTLPFYSTVTGSVKDGLELDAAYWVENMVKPVRFSAVVINLAKNKFKTFLEIAPHPALKSPILNYFEEQGLEATILASINRKLTSYEVLYGSLASLYEQGFNINWKGLFTKGGKQTEFPSVQFQRKRYWLDGGDNEGKNKSALQNIADTDILFENQWLQKDNDAKSTVNSGTWIFFADSTGHSDKIIAGAGYRVINAQTYQIDYLNPEHYLQLFNATSQLNIVGIVHFGCIGGAYQNGEVLADYYGAATKSVLYLTKTIAERGITGMNFYLVSKGVSQFENSQPAQIQQSVIWRLGRTIALELPGIICKNIDLDVVADCSGQLYYDLTHPDNEDCLVYRNGKRYVERLAKHRIATGSYQDIKCESSKTYLITGGLGGLGLKIAGWLIKRGAKHITLLSKSGVLKDYESYNKLVRSGIDIRVKKVDVSVLADLQQVFSEIVYPLGGIVHAAGVVKAKLLADQTWEEFDDVLKPKAEGAWNLHLLTKEKNIGFFVCISSISALIGSSKLSSYAAANAFLDSLAHCRKQLNLPCTSINLGPIADVGMVVKHEEVFDKNLLEKIGIQLLDSDKALEVIDYMLSNEITQLTAANLNVNRLFNALGLQTSFLNGFDTVTGAETEDDNLTAVYDELSDVDVMQSIIAQLQSITERVLEIHSHEEDKNLFDSGLDSLMVIEMVKLIQAQFKVKFDPVSVYINPSIGQMAEKIFDSIQCTQLAAS